MWVASQSPSLRGSGRFIAPRRMAVGQGERVSIPFIAGQWSLPRAKAEERARDAEFQSPSLRGSGRFNALKINSRRWPASFNPLHCGAVVASHGVSPPYGGGRGVSIPFIAGQWSLPIGGAVRRSEARRVSIPFIAGQWSLPREEGASAGEGRWFQSPSLRGSGRFSSPPPRSPYGGRRVSIPFIAGQWSLRQGGIDHGHQVGWFQSPSLRGSGRFRLRSRRGRVRKRVSIPFIAGQWSLQRPPRRKAGGQGGFNPLHCGAVVASNDPDLHGARLSCFNPLHCGAVVASDRRCGAGGRSRPVSIPFIAGQWSLPRG